MNPILEFAESYMMMNKLSGDDDKYRLYHDSMDDVLTISHKDDMERYRLKKFSFPFCMVMPSGTRIEQYEVVFNLHIDDDRKLWMELVENERKHKKCDFRYVVGGARFSFKFDTLEETLTLLAKYVWREEMKTEDEKQTIS